MKLFRFNCGMNCANTTGLVIADSVDEVKQMLLEIKKGEQSFFWNAREMKELLEEDRVAIEEIPYEKGVTIFNDI